MNKKLILLGLFVSAHSVVICQRGISIVNPLRTTIFFSDHFGTMVPGIQKIDFSGNTATQLGFSPTFTGTRNISCESPAGSDVYAAPVPMSLTNGVGICPCAADKDYSSTIAPRSAINFKIGIKTFYTMINASIPEFDQTSLHVATNNAFDGAATVVDITNPNQVRVTFKEGASYDASQLLTSYADFHYQVSYKVSGDQFVIEGSLSGPYSITDGGTVDVILGQDVADIVASADAGSVAVVGYFLGSPTVGKAHKLLTLPITLN